VTISDRVEIEDPEDGIARHEASASRRKSRRRRQPDPDPNADWDFDFSGDGRPYRFARGKVSRVRGNRGKDSLRIVRAQLCGMEKMVLGDRGDGILRHIGTSSPIEGLGECADPMSAAHRLFRPQVRPGFRDLIVAWVRRNVPQGCGLRYASLGSGELFFDVELLERIRRAGIRISQISLIDREYRRPGMDIRRALREFADWQRAAAYLDLVEPAEILVFGSKEDYFEAAKESARAAGCHVFVQCDAHWEGSLEDGSRLAARALAFKGLFARLHPEPSRRQEQGRHSTMPYTAAAWTRSWPEFLEPLPNGCSPLLEPLDDVDAQASIDTINAASRAPLSDEVLEAQRDAQQKAKEKLEILEKSRQKKEASKRKEIESQERSRRKEEAAAITAKPESTTALVQTKEVEACPPVAAHSREEVGQQAEIWEMEEQKFAIWKVTYEPRVLVRQEPKVSAKPVGLLYTGEQVIVSVEQHCGWLRIYEGPTRAKLPSEAWVNWDATSDGLGYMLEQVQ